MTPGLSRLRTYCVVYDDTLFHVQVQVPMLTLKVLVATIDAQSGGDGGCWVGEVRAGSTSPMPDQKGFKLHN